MQNQLAKRPRTVLKDYSQGMNDAFISPSQSIHRIVYSRLMINAIMVAILFTLTKNWIMPHLNPYVTLAENLSNVLECFIALTLSLPFVWSMLFECIAKRPNAKIPLFCWPRIMTGLFTFSEVAYLNFYYIHTWVVIVALALTAVIFFIKKNKNNGN